MASTQVRREIWERDKGICGICQVPVAFDRFMHIDHIVPREQDGCDHPENLRATHRPCNESRDYSDVPERHCSEAAQKIRVCQIDQQDKDNMATIRRVYRLATDSAAIRYALQQVAREARAEEQR